MMIFFLLLFRYTRKIRDLTFIHSKHFTRQLFVHFLWIKIHENMFIFCSINDEVHSPHALVTTCPETEDKHDINPMITENTAHLILLPFQTESCRSCDVSLERHVLWVLPQSLFLCLPSAPHSLPSGSAPALPLQSNPPDSDHHAD